MQRLTSAQLFAAPKRAGKTKARLERAKLVIVAARERAAGTAQQCAAQPSTMRPPTVLQRRRLVGSQRKTVGAVRQWQSKRHQPQFKRQRAITSISLGRLRARIPRP